MDKADDHSIGKSLVKWAEDDLQLRERLLKSGALFQGYNPEMRALHERNAHKLMALIEQHGWPDRQRFGADAAEAAWLIAQHSISVPALMRTAAQQLKLAYENGEAPGWQWAMMTDRICVFEGRAQKYGTQFDWDANGQMSPAPIAEPEGLDERRACLGLEPMETKINAMRAQIAREGSSPPRDWQADQMEKARFAKEVGWRSD